MTVEEVARAAGVSKQTVFNYFPVKEDLVFDRVDEVEQLMIAAVQDRPAGTTLVAAFRALTTGFWTRIAQLRDERPQGDFFRLLYQSPELQAYARELGAGITTRLAEVIRQQVGASPDDPRPQVVAIALAAAHHSVLEFAQRRIVAGEHPRDFMPELLAAIHHAYGVLEAGLTTYPSTSGETS